MNKKHEVPRIIHFINHFGQISGRTWVNIWGGTALIKFIFGQHIDWAFIGVLGFYTITKTASKFIANGVSDDKSE